MAGLPDEPAEPADLWALALACSAAAGPLYQESLAPVTAETGAQAWALSLLPLLRSRDGAATPGQRFGDLSPYARPDSFTELLATLVTAGLVDDLGAGTAYRPSPAGHHWLARTRREFGSRLRASGALPDPRGRRLAELLRKVAETAVAQEPPPLPRLATWVLGTLPDDDETLVSAVELVAALTGYRGDSHRAAWEPSGLSPLGFEALTVLWRDDPPASFAALRERLEGVGHRRGHAHETYLAAVDDLGNRGLVDRVGPDSGLDISEAGRRFRDQVEADTDRAFFAPWDLLGPDERPELRTLLIDFTTAVRARAAPEPPSAPTSSI